MGLLPPHNTSARKKWTWQKIWTTTWRQTLVIVIQIFACIMLNQLERHGMRWSLRMSINEPPHDKTNKMTVHLAKTKISLGICPVWSVFTVCMKKAWVLSYPLSAQRRLWSEPLLGTVILLVLSWGGSLIYCELKLNKVTVGFLLSVSLLHKQVTVNGILKM